MSTYTDMLKKYGIESTPGQSGASSDSGAKSGGSVFSGLGDGNDVSNGAAILGSWEKSRREQRKRIDEAERSMRKSDRRAKSLDLAMKDPRYGKDKDWTALVNAEIDAYNLDLDKVQSDYQLQTDKYNTIVSRINQGAKEWNDFVQKQKAEYNSTFGNKDWLASEAEKTAKETEQAEKDYAEAQRAGSLWGRAKSFLQIAADAASGDQQGAMRAFAEMRDVHDTRKITAQNLERAKQKQGEIAVYQSLLEPSAKRTPEETAAYIAELESKINAVKGAIKRLEKRNYNETPDLLEPGSGDYVNPSKNDSEIKRLKDRLDSYQSELYGLETKRQTDEYAALGAEYDGNIKDALYRFINNPTKAGAEETGYGEYANMTSEEVAAYNAIYAQDGRKAAFEYLKRIKNDVSARRTANMQERATDFAYNAPVTATAASVGASLTSGAGLVDLFFQNARNDLARDWGIGQYRPVNYNSDAMQFNSANQAIRGTIAEELTDASGTIRIDAEKHPFWNAMLDGKGAGDLYQIGTSIADSLATLGISQGLGGGELAQFFATSQLGGAAGASAVLEALSNGANDKQALAVGILNSAFETLFEYVSLDQLEINIKGKILGILKQSFTEGSEEFFTSLADEMANMIIMGDKSERAKAIAQYVAQNMSPQEAEKKYFREKVLAQASYDALGGFISGGLMSVGGQIAGSIADNAAAYELYGNDPQSLVNTALSYDSGMREAVSAQQKLKNGGTLSGRELRGIIEGTSKSAQAQQLYELRNEAKAELRKASEESGDILPEAIAKKALGMELSRSERKAFEASTNAEGIVRSMQETAQDKLEKRFDPKKVKNITIDTADGNRTGEIVSMHKDPKTGEVTYDVQTEDGKETVKAENAEISEHTKFVMDVLSSALDTEERLSDSATAFNLYRAGQDAVNFAAEFASARDVYGANGIALDKTQARPYFQTLNAEQIEGAWAIGHGIWENRSTGTTEIEGAQISSGTVSYDGGTMDGQALGKVDPAKFNSRQRTLDRAVHKLAEVTGLNFVLFYDESSLQGAYSKGGTIYVNTYEKANAGRMLSGQVLSHELTHWMQQYAPEQYNQLKDYVINYLLQYDGKTLENAIAQKMAREKGLSKKDALDEVVADGCQMLLKNSDAIKELARQNMNLAEKIAQFLKDLVNDLAEIFGEPNHIEARILAEAKDAQKLFDAGIKAAAENMAAEKALGRSFDAEEAAESGEKENATDNGGVRFSIEADTDIETENIEKGNAAVKYLFEKAKTADEPDKLTVTNAMYRSDIGYIDFKWGTPGLGNKFKGGYGFAHIIAKRNSENGNGEETAYKIVEVIAKATDGDIQSNEAGTGYERLRLHYDGFTVVLSKDPIANTWVLTGWENKNEAITSADGEGYDSSAATADTVTLTRRAGVNAFASDTNISQAIPEGNPKVQKSMADSIRDIMQAEAKEMEANRVRIAAANKALKREFREWQEDTERRAGFEFKVSELDEIYKELREATQFAPNSSADNPLSAADVRKRLEELANLAVKNRGGTSYDWTDELHDKMRELAADMVENAYHMTDDPISDVVEVLRQEIGGRRIYLSPALKPEVDYKGRSSFHNIRFTTKKENAVFLEDIWARMNDELPGLFPPDMSESADMFEAIDDLLSHKAQKRNLMLEQNRGQYDDLIEDITVSTELSIVKIGKKQNAKVQKNQKLNELKTALAKEQKLNKKLVEILASDEELYTAAELEIKSTKNANMNRLAQYQTALAKAREDLSAREREIDDLRFEMKKSAAMLQSDIDKLNKAYALKAAAEQARSEMLIDKYKTLYDRLLESVQNREEREQRAKLIRSIQRTEKRLQTYLTENSGKKHIPEKMKLPIGELLKSINTMPYTARSKEESQERAKYFARLKAVAAVCAEQRSYIEGSGDKEGSYLLDLPASITEQFDKLVKLAENTATQAKREWSVDAMSLEELTLLDEVLTVLSTSVTQANELIAGANAASLEQTAKSSIAYMRQIPEQKTGNKFISRRMWDNLLPIFAFERFGPGGKAIFDNIRIGWGKFAAHAIQLMDFTSELYSAEEAKRWESTEHTFELETREATGEAEAEKVTMTTAQLMSFWALMQRETLERKQAQDHIFGAGIRIASYKTVKGKTITQVKNYNVTVDDAKNMMAELAKDERAMEVIKKLQSYMNTVGTDWGNEVTMRRWGIRSFTDKNYWPIKTDSNNRSTMRLESSENSTSLYRLANMGFTKATIEGASNAIVLESAFDAWANHMSDMAKYNAIVLPMLDAMKWYNYYEKGETESEDNTGYGTTSLKRAMQVAYGDHAQRYFMQFIFDLNGVTESGSSQLERGAAKLLRNYKIAAVGANLRVALQQPTSIARAAMLMNPKYLAEGVFTQKGRSEMMQYSGLAKWKIGLGFYDVNINRSMREKIKHSEGITEKIRDKGTMLAEKADELTWTAIWNACKAELKATTDLKDEQLLEATRDRFEEIILKTQVMDSTITRSQVMRSTSLWAAQYTAFMSEPIMTANMIIDAAMDAQYAQKTRNKALAQQAGKKLVRAAVVFAFGQALTAAFAAIADAGRDDDDYQTLMQKWAEHFQENYLDNINPLKLTPVLKLLTEALETGINALRNKKWSMNSSDPTLKSLYDTLKLLPMTAEFFDDEKTALTYYGNMTGIGLAQKWFTQAGMVTGIPTGALFREVIAAYNFTAQLIADATGQKPALWQTYRAGTDSSIKQALLDGRLDEDEALAELVLSGATEDEAFLTVYKWQNGSKYAEIKAAIAANDSEAYRKAAKTLTDHGATVNDVRSAVRGYIKELYVGTEDETASIDKKTAKLYLRSFGGLSEKDADAKISEWDFAAKNGYGKDEIKQEYLSGHITEEEAKAAKIEAGYTREETEKLISDYTFEKQYGFDPGKTKSLYFAGTITTAQARSALKHNGASSEEIDAQITIFDFQKKYPEASNITVQAIEQYKQYASDISLKVFYDTWDAANKMTGIDYNGDGKSDTNSVVDQKLAFINGLKLTASQKTALALAIGIKDSTIRKRAPW